MNHDQPDSAPTGLPLEGVRVIEFTHMVMGPTCGMILADLGAEVIKIEPPGGDKTRNLPGLGIGFFRSFNRNKKSVVLDINSPKGHATALELIGQCDVMLENFRPGLMTKLGLDHATLEKKFPRLIYVSHKGFLPGPYENRLALDEVVQNMAGLTYMTGPKGRPLRAGTSVNDIMGGMFGAIGALAALAQRDHATRGTGRGQEVQSALFENNVLLVAQHMMQFAVTGKPAAPMPSRISAWGIYDVFTVAGGEQIFLAVVSDTQWAVFCDSFGLSDLKADARLASNNQRVQARDWLMPLLRERLATHSAAELGAAFEANGLPYAPITRPEELIADPHLLATGGLAPMRLPDGRAATVPLLPLTLDGQRPGVRLDPPRLGEHSEALLAELGYAPDAVETLRRDGVVRAANDHLP